MLSGHRKSLAKVVGNHSFFDYFGGNLCVNRSLLGAVNFSKLSEQNDLSGSQIDRKDQSDPEIELETDQERAKMAEFWRKSTATKKGYSPQGKGKGSWEPETPLVLDFKTKVARPNIPKSIKDECAEEAAEKLPGISPTEVTSILNCCKKGRYINKKLLKLIAKEILSRPNMLTEFRSTQICFTLHTLGMLWRRDRSNNYPFFNGFNELINALMDECVGRLDSGKDDFYCVGYSVLIHAMGVLFKRRENAAMSDRGQNLVQLVVARISDESLMRQFKHYELSNILHGCASMGYKDPAMLGKLCNEIQRRINQGSAVTSHFGASDFDSQAVSLLIWGLSKLDFFHKEALDGLSSLTVSNLAKFSPLEISNVVYGIGRLGYRNEVLVNVLEQEIGLPQRIEMFSNQHLANIVHGFGQLGHKNDELLNKLTKEMCKKNHLGSFWVQGLSNVVHAFGQLNYRNNEALNALSGEIGKDVRLRDFTCQGLSNIVFGFGQLQYRNERLLSLLCDEIVKPYKLRGFTEQGFSNILNGLVELGHNDEQVLDAIGMEISHPGRIGDFKETHLTNIVFEFGRLGYFNELVMGQLIEKVRHGVENCGNSEILQCLCGLGQLVGSMDEQFLVENVRELLKSVTSHFLDDPERVTTFTPYEISNLFWAVGKFRFYNGDLMDKMLINVVKQGKFPDLTQLCTILHSCAVLDHKNEQFLEYLKQLLITNYRSINKGGIIVESLWGLAVLGELSDKWHKDLNGKLIEIIKKNGEISVVHKKQLSNVWEYMRQPGSGHSINLHNKWMINEMEISNEDACIGGGSSPEGSVVNEVSAAMTDMGLHSKLGGEIGGGNLSVDLVVNGEVAVNVLNFDDFCINEVNGSFRKLGHVGLKTRSIEANGCKVMHIPSFEWTKLNADQQRVYIQSKLSKLMKTELNDNEGS